MNLSWANHFAKTALKTAQQKIDSVLDIRPEEGETSVTIEDVITDDLLANPIVPLGAAEELSVPAPSSTSSGNGESWSNAWSSVTADQELIVDSEPNPIRDEAPHPPASLFDHSPSSNSSDGVEPGQSPQKVGDYEETKRDETVINEKSAYVDVDLSVPTDDTQFVSSSDTIQEESVLRPLPAIVRQNSHQDDSVTVASSDIEVIRNADAWSIASSKPATDHIPSHVLTTKHDSTESFRTQLLHAEQRRNELKAANDTLQSNNVQLQQRIIVLNQQHSSLKKELEDKKTELEDLLAEGKRLSDHSGKQAREIRRLKSELAELEKVKAERKRLKDEKLRAEETIDLQKEEISSLKGMVKQLELNAERLLKEQSMREASTEVAQKQAQEQNRLVAELEEELADSRKQIEELIDNNKKLTREAELMQSANWSERLAGERANETVATMSAELSEARAHVERLKSQLQSTENRLDVVLNERNSVAECISQANIPLLDEISNLKQALHREQRASEESDIKTRSLTRELAVVKEQSEKLKGINDSLISQHHQELTVVNQKVQHLEHELAQVYKERERVASEYKLARVADAAALEDLRESNDALSNELSELRSVVKEIREENETLKTSLEEACAERREPPRPVEKVPQKQPQKESDFVDSNPFGDLVSPAPSVAPFSFASHQSTPNIHHDMSLKRITFLEQEAVRCFQLEDQVRQLKKELQTLNAQYNGLLVVDGERLERIEELENDVIDLRQLLKEQV
ncbi:hypothetical protein Q1695_000880 [Nippostrongylus brasiliensis]|nr:hypothetical protein Q1695_000880 [Nippostrongylus brasiliensis]